MLNPTYVCQFTFDSCRLHDLIQICCDLKGKTTCIIPKMPCNWDITAAANFYLCYSSSWSPNFLEQRCDDASGECQWISFRRRNNDTCVGCEWGADPATLRAWDMGVGSDDDGPFVFREKQIEISSVDHPRICGRPFSLLLRHPCSDWARWGIRKKERGGFSSLDRLIAKFHTL